MATLVVSCGPPGVDLSVLPLGEARSAVLSLAFADRDEVHAFEPSDPPVIEDFATDAAEIGLWTFGAPLSDLELTPGIVTPPNTNCSLPAPSSAWVSSEDGWAPIERAADSPKSLTQLKIPTAVGDCCPLDPRCEGCTRLDFDVQRFDFSDSLTFVASVDATTAIARFEKHEYLVRAEIAEPFAETVQPSRGFQSGRKLYFAEAGDLMELDLDDALVRIRAGESPFHQRVVTSTTELGDLIGSPLREPNEFFDRKESQTGDTGMGAVGSTVFRHWSPERGWRAISSETGLLHRYQMAWLDEGRVILASRKQTVHGEVRRLNSDGSLDSVPIRISGSGTGAVYSVWRGPNHAYAAASIGPALHFLEYYPNTDEFVPVTTLPAAPGSDVRVIEAGDSAFYLTQEFVTEVLVDEGRACPRISVDPTLVFEAGIEHAGGFLFAGRGSGDSDSGFAFARRRRQ